MLSPETVAHIKQRVNEFLRSEADTRRRSINDRRVLEEQLRDALAELNNIRDAIRRGLLSDLTRQMLNETEDRVRQIRARLDVSGQTQSHALELLPEAIQSRLEQFDRILLTDVDEARTALRKLLGNIVLQPTPQRLVAELQGNIEGLLSLEESQALNRYHW